jgi:hypothetical protein
MTTTYKYQTNLTIATFSFPSATAAARGVISSSLPKDKAFNSFGEVGDSSTRRQGTRARTMDSCPSNEACISRDEELVGSTYEQLAPFSKEIET